MLTWPDYPGSLYQNPPLSSREPYVTAHGRIHDFKTIGSSRAFYEEISIGQLRLQYLNLRRLRLKQLVSNTKNKTLKQVKSLTRLCDATEGQRAELFGSYIGFKSGFRISDSLRCDL